MKLFQFLGLAMPVLVNALAATDEPQSADPPQSGYLPNHNLAPSTLAGFAKKWNLKFNSNEKLYSMPVVYTPSGSTQELVIIGSIQNVVRVVDSATGQLVKIRTLDAPYISSDSNCNDGATVGITGTPVIDPATDIMYLFSKGYMNGLAGPQGAYKMWALHIPDLTVVPGYPVLIQGPASNDPTKYFNGGEILQRPGLTMIGDSIIAGFGGHCDSMNYTGILLTVSKTTGQMQDQMVMMASPGSPWAPDLQAGKGGKAGIWQSGMAIAADLDKNRVFFATGNSDVNGDLGGINGAPHSGKVPISTLGQAIANIGVDPVSGNLTQQDFFVPVGYAKLNSGDKDFSAGGVSLLDPTVFNGGGVNRVALGTSKVGTLYVMDAENLGGYKQGPGGTTDGKKFSKRSFLQRDRSTVALAATPRKVVISSMQISTLLQITRLNENSFCHTGAPLQAWRLTPDASGKPNFKFAGQSALSVGCHGTPTVTSQNGVAGTGIVWLSDTTKGLIAFNAVPNGSSVLTQITVPGSGGLTKFHRPVFGNNNVFVTTSNHLIAIGGPKL
ncbi:uncharacterized protein K444DRAFT_711847 [Hyaloscypha bicolor E]|uniref:Uncharacterized protein n=1 Tax=Hyaloscypha bicolor E TaxID=1095630 RepID=A0A2J6SGG2_9HELO|nr:uncharacterized protein K444DRAFT_711847 [Hyaloscypha bicolor E]PMD49844.1 hypothetical protein K444DRAFT_711847 [Hyaloscypha bicolor E]